MLPLLCKRNGKDQEHVFFPDEVISLSAQLMVSALGVLHQIIWDLDNSLDRDRKMHILQSHMQDGGRAQLFPHNIKQKANHKWS